MENPLTRWLHRRKDGPPVVTLNDVVPAHPDEYPAQRMKRKLDSRRDALHEIEERGQPMGMPEGPDGF